MSKRFIAVLAVVTLVVWVAPATAAAQESPGGVNNVRAFGGFSYLRFSADGGVDENLYGAQGNVTYYFTPRIGFFVDGAFNIGDVLPDDAPEGITSADLTQTSLLFGPRFVITGSRSFTAEGFVGIGWAIGSVDVRGTTEQDVNVFERFDQNAFAASFGVSLDAMFGNGDWGIRFAQLEVLVAKYDDTQTNFRYSGGIVGRF